jgi:acyl dehydratase
MLGAGLISSVLGTELPGPGAIYLSQDLRFLDPGSIDDTITTTLIVTEKYQSENNVTLDCR